MDPIQNEREEIFTGLYLSVFPGFASFVKKQGGTLEDAKDVFQEALIVLYEKKQMMMIGRDQGYLYSTARFIWYKKTGNEKGLVSMQADFDQPELSDPNPLTGEILGLIGTAGERCLKLLKAFYYDGLNMKSIAGYFGFSGVRSATVQKYKCLEKVRDKVKENHLVYEDFFE